MMAARRIHRRMAENLPGERGAGKRLRTLGKKRRRNCPPPRIPYRIHRKVLDRIALEEYNRLNRWGRRKAEMGIARSLGT